jgi:hypothetical protein
MLKIESSSLLSMHMTVDTIIKKKKSFKKKTEHVLIYIRIDFQLKEILVHNKDKKLNLEFIYISLILSGFKTRMWDTT